MKTKRVLCIVFFISLALGVNGFAAEPVKPSGGDKCPVCGMFVAKYPDFLAEIIFKNGSYAVFDGAKDMFKYLLDMAAYQAPGKMEDIESIYVTDYYGLNLIDGRKAIFVVGSNVLGPMGHELIPFEKEEDAKEFMSDHAGKKKLQFKEVDRDTMKGLD